MIEFLRHLCRLMRCEIASGWQLSATTMCKRITPKRRGQRGATAIVQIIARGAFRGRCCSKYATTSNHRIVELAQDAGY